MRRCGRALTTVTPNVMVEDAIVQPWHATLRNINEFAFCDLNRCI